MAATVDVIEWGHERARAGSWRGERLVGYLSPLPGAPAPSPSFVRRCLDALSARGFLEVVTGALSPAEQRAFLAAGFEVREHLVLLAHDLRDLPRPPHPAGGDDASLRRARRGDRTRVLEVDEAAFAPFWRLDENGLDEALDATPSTRFRVAVDSARRVLAYAVCGRAGRQGYVQRLAVDPRSQRAGLGRRLVLDGLGWMTRRGVDRVVVNTQPDNERALALYQRLGFRLQPVGLDVLGRRLDT